jgi:hypothetical protein
VRFIKYYWGDQIEEMGEARSTLGRDEKCIQNICRKLEMKSPLGRTKRRCGDNIKIDVREIR